MWKKITEEDIREALFNQSVQKAPGPDRLGFKAIRLLWDWDYQRIINIVKVWFRLGVHPRVWKEAKGWLYRNRINQITESPRHIG